MALQTTHLKRCIDTLESSISLLDQAEVGSIDYEIYRNASVKGFELTLETAGKLLRKSLKPFFPSGKAVDQLYFKDLFRHAAKHGLISLDEVERWLGYRDNRNSTAHDYGEGFAEETKKLLPGFIKDARSLLATLDHAATQSQA